MGDDFWAAHFHSEAVVFPTLLKYVKRLCLKSVVVVSKHLCIESRDSSAIQRFINALLWQCTFVRVS